MVAGEGAASPVVPVGLWRALARVGSPARHSPRSNRNYSYKPQFRSGPLRRLSASGGIVSECRFWPLEPAQSNLTPLAVEARTLARSRSGSSGLRATHASVPKAFDLLAEFGKFGLERKMSLRSPDAAAAFVARHFNAAIFRRPTQALCWRTGNLVMKIRQVRVLSARPHDLSMLSVSIVIVHRHAQVFLLRFALPSFACQRAKL